MPGLDLATRVYVRTPENAYKLFAHFGGKPHGDFRLASGQIAYDIEFPAVLDAALCAKALGQWFAKADLRSAVSVAFSDRPVTSLGQSVVMTFVCYYEAVQVVWSPVGTRNGNQVMNCSEHGEYFYALGMSYFREYNGCPDCYTTGQRPAPHTVAQF